MMGGTKMITTFLLSHKWYMIIQMPKKIIQEICTLLEKPA